jgi:hypothetical protein
MKRTLCTILSCCLASAAWAPLACVPSKGAAENGAPKLPTTASGVASPSTGGSVMASAPPSAPSTAATIAPPPLVPTPGAKACGRLPDEPIKQGKWPWGTDKACDDLITRWTNVTHQERVCTATKDCVVRSQPNACNAAAINRFAADSGRYEQLPCGHPAAGACLSPEYHAACEDGCCVLR